MLLTKQANANAAGLSDDLDLDDGGKDTERNT